MNETTYTATGGEPRFTISGYTILATPKRAGYWLVSGNVKLYVTRRPRWLTRLMARWFFEVEWHDERS